MAKMAEPYYTPERFAYYDNLAELSLQWRRCREWHFKPPMYWPFKPYPMRLSKRWPQTYRFHMRGHWRRLNARRNLPVRGTIAYKRMTEVENHDAWKLRIYYNGKQVRGKDPTRFASPVRKI